MLMLMPNTLRWQIEILPGAAPVAAHFNSTPATRTNRLFVSYVLLSHCYIVYCVSTINRHITHAVCTHARAYSILFFSSLLFWIVQYLHNLTAGTESWTKASWFFTKKVLCQIFSLAYLCQDDGQQHLRVDTFIFS